MGHVASNIKFALRNSGLTSELVLWYVKMLAAYPLSQLSCKLGPPCIKHICLVNPTEAGLG